MLFAQAGVNYEDCRINGEDWGKLKSKTLMGFLPILEVDGKELYQSHAIARYVAATCKLAGSNNLEAAQCDGVLETLADLKAAFFSLFVEKDEAKKTDEIKKKLFEEKIKPKLAILEKMLVKNGDVLVGKTITVADIGFYQAAEAMDQCMPMDHFADFPKLRALKQKVCKEPKIAAWIAKRPDTGM